MEQGKKIIKTIDATPTWRGILNWMLSVIEDSQSSAAKAEAKKQLERMADVADMYVGVLKKQEQDEKEVEERVTNDSSKQQNFLAESIVIEYDVIVDTKTHQRIAKLLTKLNATTYKIITAYNWHDTLKLILAQYLKAQTTGHQEDILNAINMTLDACKALEIKHSFERIKENES